MTYHNNGMPYVARLEANAHVDQYVSVTHPKTNRLVSLSLHDAPEQWSLRLEFASTQSLRAQPCGLRLNVGHRIERTVPCVQQPLGCAIFTARRERTVADSDAGSRDRTPCRAICWTRQELRTPQRSNRIWHDIFFLKI